MRKDLLKAMATPQAIKQDDAARVAQQKVMDTLNKTSNKLPLEHDVYRLGALHLRMNEKQEIEYTFSKNKPAPAGLAEGYETLMRPNKDLEHDIAKSVIGTMEKAGQLEYLKEGLIQNKGYDVSVDVDFYRKRGKGQAGFHKDTTGNSLFVNLQFNNSNPVIGPEYIVNPPPVASHDQQIEDTLPQEFMDDVKELRNELDRPAGIESDVLEPYSSVSFVDELIHHSTPLLTHRGISIQEFEENLTLKDRSFLMEAIAAKNILHQMGDHSEDIFSKADLENAGFKEGTRQGKLLKKLLKDKKIRIATSGNSYVSLTKLKKQNPKLHRDLLDYLRLKSTPADFLSDIQKLFQSKRQNEKVVKEEITALPSYLPKRDQSMIESVFIGKTDMNQVGLAHCEDECHKDTKVQSEQIFQDRPPRRMSIDLNNDETKRIIQAQKDSTEKRQFLRSWVQVHKTGQKMDGTWHTYKPLNANQKKDQKQQAMKRPSLKRSGSSMSL